MILGFAFADLARIAADRTGTSLNLSIAPMALPSPAPRGRVPRAMSPGTRPEEDEAPPRDEHKPFAPAGKGEGQSTAKKTLSLSPVLEIRERFERRDNKSFSSHVADDRSDLLSRYRPGLAFNYYNVTGKIVYQSSQDLGWSYNKGNGATNNSDLLLAYATIPNADGSATVGRQRLNKGSERILGESDWNNITNTWDGVRFTSQTGDLFAAKLGTAAAESRSARLLGFSTDTRFGMSMAMVQHDVIQGARFDIYTFDQYYTHRYLGFNWTLEGMAETGAVGTKDLQAFAASAKVVKPFGNKLSATLEADIASGGGNSARTNLFTNYYATKHPFDGNSDMQGLANVREIQARLGYAVSPKLTSSVAYYRFGLYSPTDGWYNKNEALNKDGNVSFIDPTGSKGRDIGQEIDWDNKWSFRKDASLSAGLATFLPGAFVKAFTPDASKTQYWFYLQASYKFGG